MTSGPISDFLSIPGPTFKDSTFFAKLFTNLSPMPPTATATDCAIHLSPAEPYAAPISPLTAWSKSQSGITTQ